MTLLMFLFSPSLIGKCMSVHGIPSPEPLAAFPPGSPGQRGNALKGSRPQEDDGLSFLHNAVSDWKCMRGK